MMYLSRSARYALAAFCFAASLCAPDTSLAQTGKSGEMVYKETCLACHATGLEKAPKFGDHKAWVPLIKEGQARITADGWVGERGMPARGGNPNLSLEEFARAVAFMARAGGGNWKDPDSAMLERIRSAEKKRLDHLKAKKPPAG